MKNLLWNSFAYETFAPKVRDRVRAFEHVMPPTPFFFSGDAAVDPAQFSEKRFIGVIGTRRPTAYGLRFLNLWLDLQVAEGFTGCILSGGALGIDGAVHRGALVRGLETQAVVVGPKQCPNPRSHHEMFKEMTGKNRGGIWVPACLDPGPGEFPQTSWWLMRNQWLSAMCDVLIVVEAGLHSGTWYTVKIAQKFGIPVYALPGAFDSVASEGTNAMISRGYAHSILSLTELQKTLVVDLGESTYNIDRGSKERARWSAARGSPKSRAETKLLKQLKVWHRQPGGVGLSDLALMAIEAGYRVSQLDQALEELGHRGELSQLGDRFEGRS